MLSDPALVGTACAIFTTAGLIATGLIIGLVFWLERRRHVERKRLLEEGRRLRQQLAKHEQAQRTDDPDRPSSSLDVPP